MEQQPGNEQPQFPDINELQAQIGQLQRVLQNHLPPHVRQQTQMQLQLAQEQLQQAQMVMAVAASMSQANAAMMSGGGMMPYQDDSYAAGYNTGVGMGNYKGNWTNPFPNQQPAGAESAYQRLPVNNRRRVHHNRPSDYYEVGGGGSTSYWE